MLLKLIDENEGTLSDVFNTFPRVAVPILELCETVMRGPSSFTVGERELIAAYVSKTNDCGYCAMTHTEAAETLGAKNGVVTELLANIETAEVDEKMRPVLAYVKKLCLNPNSLKQEDVDKIIDAGWDEYAVHDAVSVCAMFQFFNHYVMGLGLDEGEKAVGRGKLLSQYGYAVMIDKLKLRDKAKADK